MNQRPDNGHSDRVLSFMRSHDLFAVDSMFKPKSKFMFATGDKRRKCNATYLQKDVSLRPKKLDYFLVSNRWRSCVKNSDTKWAPSIHRFGRAFDHSLLQITWRWRTKSAKLVVGKDFKAMLKSDWVALDTAIDNNLKEQTNSQGAQETDVVYRYITETNLRVHY